MILRILVLFQTLFVFETVIEVVQANHRCYVCIPNTGSSISDVLQMFPEGTAIPLCNRFDIDEADYVRECPSPSYQGCLTQTNGSHVTKTCTLLGIEDCKTANKIKYCYCKDELCNKESVPKEAPPPPSTDDDEDSAPEGSGSPESSDSSHMETSSETDLNIEVIRKKLPTTTTTTTRSVIQTTAGPREEGGKGSATPSRQPLNFLYIISFLLILKVNFHPFNSSFKLLCCTQLYQ